MVFYDFVTGLDMTSNVVRLVVGLYNNSALYGEPTILPAVCCGTNTTNSYTFQQGANVAVLSAKQAVPRLVIHEYSVFVVILNTVS